MRTTLPARALGAALLLTWGCGGNVVVDGTPAGTGGSTTGTAGSGTSSSGSPSPFTCDFACGGPVGLCGCTGPCSDGNTRAIGCGGATATGFVCDCSVNGQTAGMCNSPALACQLEGSCCQAIFGN